MKSISATWLLWRVTGSSAEPGLRPASVPRPKTRLSLPFLLLALLSLLLPSLASPQYYQIHNYTEENGLPSTSSLSIAQDREGIMWFATRRGVVSYDANTWTSYQNGSGNAPVGVDFLALDKRERLWMLDAYGMLYRMDGPDRFEAIAHVVVDTASALRIQMGALLDDGVQVQVAIIVDGKLFVYNGKRLVGQEKLSIDPALSFFGVQVYNNQFTFATSKGLFVLPTGYDHLLPLLGDPGDRQPVRGLGLDTVTVAHERLWFATGRDICYLEQGQITTFARYNPFTFGGPEKRLSFCPDGHGGLLGASNTDLVHILPDGTIRRIGRGNGLGFEGAEDMLLDREKNIWIVNTRGIARISSFAFENYNSANGLYQDEATSVVRRLDGAMVIGHQGGVTVYQDGRFRKIPIPEDLNGPIPPEHARILDMEADSATNRVWIAAERLGLLELTPDGTIRRCGSPDNTTHVLALTMQDDGTILLGTDMGLARYKPDRNRIVPVPSPVHTLVRKLVPDPVSGDVFVAMLARGLVLWSPKGSRTIAQTDNQEALSVYNVTRSRDGRILAGTLAGLYEVRNDSLVLAQLGRYTITQPVYLFRKQGDVLWIGTNAGLFRWDGEQLDHYTTHEGLAGNETNRDAIESDKAGNLWIGTAVGLSIYRDRFDNGPPSPPVTELVDLRVDTTSYGPDQSIRYSSAKKDLVVQFRVITYRFEDRIQYRYGLQDLRGNTSSRVITPINKAQFLNVTPGVYHFLVQARLGHGSWGPITRSSRIVVLPPFYETWWFRGAGLLALIALFVLIHRYILSRRTARLLESEVQVERFKLSQVVRNTKTIIVQADGNGVITYVNPDVREILGYEPSEIVGFPYHKILAPEDRQNVSESFRRQVARKKQTAVLQCRLIDNLARPNWYNFSISLTMEDGKVAGMTAVAQDINELRELEERLHHSQKLEAVGMLAGGVAHDFNNLLTAIAGHTELAQLEVGGDTPLAKHLQEIDKAASSAATLTRQLLAFSRKQTLQPKIIHLNTVVLERVAMLKRLIGEEIRLEVDLAEDLWATRADPGQLEQVIVNLVVNSRDAMESGGWLTLKTSNRSVGSQTRDGIPPGDYVMLSVLDTGSGISPELQERIFEPFFTTKEKGRGTGLGLATVYGIISQSDGYVTLNSKPGQGTTFNILLPRVEGHVVNAPERENGRPIAKGRETILVVEDEDAVRELAVVLLRRQGYDVLEASNGEEALERVETLTRPIDLLITDVIMPKMNGPELAEGIRRKWPETRVLFMSGYASTYIEHRGLLSEENQILLKPFRMEVLSTRVRDVLDRPVS